jgi:citrate/tricarballylate utilization protein
MGFAAFSGDTGEAANTFFKPAALGQGILDALQLRYLDGGGEGCAYPGEVASQSRRWFHHLTFYGFSLCFAATTVAAIYHYAFRWEAPYRFWSAPVMLGTLGGLGLLIGPLGLLWLKGKRDLKLTERKQTEMDVSFLALLFLTSLTGFLLLILREKPAMGVLLAIHLGVVMGLFLMMPYGKFVHAVYRFAALVQNAAERRRPVSRLGPD